VEQSDTLDLEKRKELLGKFECGPRCFFEDPSIGPTYGYLPADEFVSGDSVIIESVGSFSSPF
jgi:hypothetical protein